MIKRKFILCEDGSYLKVKNITRLFLAEDAITKGCSIRACVIGSMIPFVVADFGNRTAAAVALQALVGDIEGN